MNIFKYDPDRYIQSIKYFSSGCFYIIGTDLF